MDGIPELYAWLDSHGADRAVEVCESVYGTRGLCAMKDITAGDMCLRIPQMLMITAKSAARECPDIDRLTQGMPEELENVRDTVILVLFLILQKVCRSISHYPRTLTSRTRSLYILRARNVKLGSLEQRVVPIALRVTAK